MCPECLRLGDACLSSADSIIRVIVALASIPCETESELSACDSGQGSNSSHVLEPGPRDGYGIQVPTTKVE